MKKRVGILTICKVNNYGAELQAFATLKVIKQCGYDAEIIDYIYYKNWRFKDSEMSRPFIPMTIKEKMMYWLKYRGVNWGVDILLPIFYRVEKKRKQRYAEFHSLMDFSRPFYSMKDLYKGKCIYDIYVTGSDQVWNPAASSSIEPYFLTFAPKESRKISYASSFGVSELDNNLQEIYRKLLNNFDVISVREQSGVDLVKKLCNKEVHLVADPTLLLNIKDWQPYMKDYPNMPLKYVLIYQLASSSKLVEQAIDLGKEIGCPIYRICKRSYRNEENKGVINIKDAGPQEFISLISKASFIVTNSFHGTAFSVNFHTPFYVVLSKKKKNNSRIESLLEKLHIEDRIIYDNEAGLKKNYSLPDYEKELNEIRNQSISYLKDNLDK